MQRRRQAIGVAAWGLALAVAAVGAQRGSAVPSDLKPLLAAPRSELHLVGQRYTLSGNYAHGSPGGRRGRGNLAPGAPAAAQPVPLSTARVARLKRFDLSW